MRVIVGIDEAWDDELASPVYLLNACACWQFRNLPTSPEVIRDALANCRNAATYDQQISLGREVNISIQRKYTGTRYQYRRNI